jgi:hypothetical protein
MQHRQWLPNTTATRARSVPSDQAALHVAMVGRTSVAIRIRSGICV